jgi:hypothetical protein
MMGLQYSFPTWGLSVQKIDFEAGRVYMCLYYQKRCIVISPLGFIDLFKSGRALNALGLLAKVNCLF